jgi:site-specific DNA-cytosine methylase
LPSVRSATSSRLLSVSILLFHKNLSLDSSEDFGVPQKRHRAFFFAVRDDIGCEVDLANSPVFHFKKYAHVKFSEIQEKISE